MNILYLGCSGFPIGYAQVQKQKMISKALLEAGAKVTVISYKGVMRPSELPNIAYKGKVEGIDYIFASLTAKRPNSYLLRNALKVLGSINEFFIIIAKTSLRKKNVAIITTHKIAKLKYYSLLLKILNYKVVLSYEEFGSSGPNLGEVTALDTDAHKYCHAILPISTFLENYQRQLRPNIKLFKVPVLADFSAIDAIVPDVQRIDKILFCGASAYYETITFIVDAFHKVKTTKTQLVLVIHGNQQQNEKVRAYVKNSNLADRITIESSLPYSNLITLYKTSTLLLIPLKNSERDSARFPHKISEYTASKTPLVTTAVGEINSYFTDAENAFIASEWNVDSFAEKITFALQNPNLAANVAHNAYVLGKAKFDYKSIALDLSSFLNEV